MIHPTLASSQIGERPDDNKIHPRYVTVCSHHSMSNFPPPLSTLAVLTADRWVANADYADVSPVLHQADPDGERLIRTLAPLTSHLSFSIMQTIDKPDDRYSIGSMGLYMRLNGHPETVYGLTCRHVASANAYRVMKSTALMAMW